MKAWEINGVWPGLRLWHANHPDWRNRLKEGFRTKARDLGDATGTEVVSTQQLSSRVMR